MKPLAGTRILLTNDDGYHAPGLEALEEIANVRLQRVGEEVRASISIGAESFRGEGLDCDAMVEAVDQLLYQAKQLGGSRSCLGENAAR